MCWVSHWMHWLPLQHAIPKWSSTGAVEGDRWAYHWHMPVQTWNEKEKSTLQTLLSVYAWFLNSHYLNHCYNSQILPHCTIGRCNGCKALNLICMLVAAGVVICCSNVVISHVKTNTKIVLLCVNWKNWSCSMCLLKLLKGQETITGRHAFALVTWLTIWSWEVSSNSMWSFTTEKGDVFPSTWHASPKVSALTG